MERDNLSASFFDQIGGLLKRHVAIVVAINQQHAFSPEGAPAQFTCRVGESGQGSPIRRPALQSLKLQRNRGLGRDGFRFARAVELDLQKLLQWRPSFHRKS